MREIVRMIVVLTAIAAASGFLLSFVEHSTRDPIAYQKLKFVKGPAVSALLSESENDPIADLVKDLELKDGSGAAVKTTIFPSFKNGSLDAVAFEVKKAGYHGDVSTMMAVKLASRELIGIRVVQHTETPGLGARILEEEFFGQFAGLSSDGLALSSDGGQVAAISGASISSVAVTDSVRNGMTILDDNFDTISTACSGG